MQFFNLTSLKNQKTPDFSIKIGEIFKTFFKKKVVNISPIFIALIYILLTRFDKKYIYYMCNINLYHFNVI